MPTTPLQYSDLADQINRFMAGQANNQYLTNLPNYAQMVGQRSTNTGQMLKGQLPQDVINQIGQQAAERGIAGGAPGSPNTNAAYLRALGLNSLQMQQQGSNNLSAGIADTPVSPLFNPASMIVPNYFGQQELNNARLGALTSRRSGGVSAPSSVGVPNLGFGTTSPRGSNIDFQQGMLNSGTFRNGMFTGAGAAPQSGDLASNWWNSYGGSNLSSDQTSPDILGPYNQGGSSGGAYGPYDPFAEEDAWMANNTSDSSGFWEDYL